MFKQLRECLLYVMRVPPEPEPPFGDPASTRIFRASPKYYSFRLLGWGLRQVFAFIGLAVGVVIVLMIETNAAQIRTRPRLENLSLIQTENNSAETKPKAKKLKQNREFKDVINALAIALSKVPPRWFFIIWLIELMGLLFYLTQVSVTYALLRLDYELRWYVVTDRSLRIRTGIWRVQELTMSFANLQQVVLSQGPIQRLLGIADLRVQSAGGGGSEHSHQSQLASLHAGYFHGVDNAAEVRDLILTRLRHFRETGLGDFDEIREVVPPLTIKLNSSVSVRESDVLSAARELLTETQQFRSAVIKADFLIKSNTSG